MRKIIISALLCSVILWQGCTTTTAATKTGVAEKKATAEKKAAAPTAAALEQGKSLYNTKCQRCHALYKSTDFTATEWRKNVDAMAPKAHLTPEETAFIYTYLIADCKK